MHFETQSSVSDLREKKIPNLDDIQNIFYLKRNDGSFIHIRSLGLGTISFVFIHGWGLDSQSWFPLMETLAPQHRSLALDLPGHGKSTIAGKKIELVEATVDLLQELRSPVVLIGHSMGARVAALAASRCPSLVSGLVSVDGDVNGQSLAPRTRWKIVRHFASEKGARVTELYLARLCRGGINADCWPLLESMSSVIPLEVKRQSLEWLLTNNEVVSVRCPAHAILSDLTTTKYRTIALQGAIPHVSVEIIPYSDHFLPVSSTGVVADRLNRFHREYIAL